MYHGVLPGGELSATVKELVSGKNLQLGGLTAACCFDSNSSLPWCLPEAIRSASHASPCCLGAFAAAVFS